MNNLLKTKITESPNGAHERASHTTIETIYKGLMNKIGAGQVTIHYQSKNMWKRVVSCYNAIFGAKFPPFIKAMGIKCEQLHHSISFSSKQ